MGCQREALLHRRVLIALGGMILTALLVLHLYQPVQAQALKRVAEGQAAPEFTLTTTAGASIASKDLQGKVLAICFWKFGSKSEEELVALRQAYAKYKDKELEVLAVYVPQSDEKVSQEEIQNIEALQKDKALDFTMLIDTGMKLFNDYGVITMPTLIILDKGGKVASIYSGFPKFGGEKEINKRLETALGIAPMAAAKVEEKAYVPKGQAGKHYKFGQRFYSMGFLDKAVDKLKESLQEDPDFPAAHLLLAKIYASQGDKDNAMNEFNMAIASEPENLEVHIEYGNFAIENKMYDEAMAEFETVKALNPDKGAGDLGLGQLYLAQEKYAEAAPAFQAAIDLYTGKKSEKGNLFGMLKQKKAKTTNPDVGPAYYGLAQAQLKLGQQEEAAENFQEAIKCYQQVIEQIRKEAAAAEEKE